MNKKQLANGAITVWLDEEQTIIHHANGLTLALTVKEAQELKTWLEEQDTAWEERAEFEDRQRMEKEDALAGEKRPGDGWPYEEDARHGFSTD